MDAKIKQQLQQALSLDKSGDWHHAHRIVQQIDTTESYQIHAYLHRKEGDLNNAHYWYHRAHTQMPNESLASEWNRLVQAITED